MSKKIYLIDGNSFIYRMFFALPEFTTKDGKPVNATFGMAKFFVNQLKREKPDYLIFIKDAKGKNFRHDIYEDYKATRDRMPDSLRAQIGDIETLITKMGIEIVEISGYEADDVIGTLAIDLGKDKDNEVYILSGDKDLYSLVSNNVKIYDTQKKKVFGLEETKEKFGIDSKLIIDYLAIVGDKADNIPGIDGFGPKKAIDLINVIGTVEEIYNIVEKVESGKKLDEVLEVGEDDIKKVSSCFKGKTYEKLLNSKDDAFLSKKLATIIHDVELDNFSLENFKFDGTKLLNNDSIEFFKELEFNSLIGEEEKELKSFKSTGIKVNIIGDLQGLKELESKISNFDKIVLDTETTSLEVQKASLVGVSIFLDEKNIFYINRLHNGPKVDDTSLKDFLNKLFSLDITIIGHNLKYDLEILELYLNDNIIKNQSKNDGQISLGI